MLSHIEKILNESKLNFFKNHAKNFNSAHKELNKSGIGRRFHPLLCLITMYFESSYSVLKPNDENYCKVGIINELKRQVYLTEDSVVIMIKNVKLRYDNESTDIINKGLISRFKLTDVNELGSGIGHFSFNKNLQFCLVFDTKNTLIFFMMNLKYQKFVKLPKYIKYLIIEHILNF